MSCFPTRLVYRLCVLDSGTYQKQQVTKSKEADTEQTSPELLYLFVKQHFTPSTHIIIPRACFLLLLETERLLFGSATRFFGHFLGSSLALDCKCQLNGRTLFIISALSSAVLTRWITEFPTFNLEKKEAILLSATGLLTFTERIHQ